jgi:hypothetical protein
MPSATGNRWRNLGWKLVVDVIIAGLVGVMMYRNFLVTSFTMVPWRCEFSWLLFAW